MLNNQKVGNISALAFLPYQMKVELFDKNCSKCQFSRTQIKINDELSKPMNTEEAVSKVALDSRATIVRSCSEDDGYSLNDICRNTCVMWTKGEHNDDSTEVTDLVYI